MCHFVPGDKWSLCRIYNCPAADVLGPSEMCGEKHVIAAVIGYERLVDKCSCEICQKVSAGVVYSLVSHRMAGNSPPRCRLLCVIDSNRGQGKKQPSKTIHVSEVCVCSCSIEKDL